MLDTMLKNHIIELHNQEMDYQLRKQAKLIEELNEVIVNQKRTMKKHGIIQDKDMPVIAEDEDYLMEEFDEENKSHGQQGEFEKIAEEELVEQLEDFETLRENLSDNDDDFDEEQDEVVDMAEKENNSGKGGKRILKNPSQRQIYTSDGDRPKDFGIIGKGFNDKVEDNLKLNNKIRDNKAKEQMSPRGEKRDDKRYKKDNNINKIRDNKDKDRAIKELDPNVMITGNQLRPGEVIGNEKSKNDKNQKSIIGWFKKNKI
jgi:uncharacterized coiled-coil protein SlyX